MRKKWGEGLVVIILIVNTVLKTWTLDPRIKGRQCHSNIKEAEYVPRTDVSGRGGGRGTTLCDRFRNASLHTFC